jgi:hypothetical protein
VEVRLQSFLVSALAARELSNSRSGRFNSGKDFPVFTEYETGLAPDPIWMLYKTEKSLAPVKNGTPDSADVQAVP